MTEEHLMDNFNRDNIEKIAQEQGFRDSQLLERFIRLFEVMSYTQRELSDCAVKGGTGLFLSQIIMQLGIAFHTILLIVSMVTVVDFIYISVAFCTRRHS